MYINYDMGTNYTVKSFYSEKLEDTDLYLLPYGEFGLIPA